MLNLIAEVKLVWHLLTVPSTATVKAPAASAPTIPAPAQTSSDYPPPPRLPWEFGPFAASGFDAGADPLRDVFPLRSYDADK